MVNLPFDLFHIHDSSPYEKLKRPCTTWDSLCLFFSYRMPSVKLCVNRCPDSDIQLITKLCYCSQKHWHHFHQNRTHLNMAKQSKTRVAMIALQLLIIHWPSLINDWKGNLSYRMKQTMFIHKTTSTITNFLHVKRRTCHSRAFQLLKLLRQYIWYFSSCRYRKTML